MLPSSSFYGCDHSLALAHLITALHMWPLASIKTALSSMISIIAAITSPLPPSCVNLMDHFLHHFIIFLHDLAFIPPLSPSNSSLMLCYLHSFFIIMLLHYSIMLLHYSINPPSHYRSGFYSSTGFMGPSTLLSVSYTHLTLPTIYSV